MIKALSEKIKRRVVDMDELRTVANDPMWDQGETANEYRIPLPTDHDFSKFVDKLTLGIPDKELYKIGPFKVIREWSDSHLGPFKYAIDFLVPDGTEIMVAKDGQIIEAVDSFNEWGPTEEFRDKLNYVTVQHENNEFSQYCHLAKNSFQNADLKVEDYVREGQIIGRVGKTGWTDRDHLHFIVFRVGKLPGSPYEFYSLQIRFKSFG